MGPSSRLAVPSGMAGFFLAIGETCAWGWAVLWGSKERPAPSGGVLLYALLLVKEPLTTGASVNLFKSAAVCLVVVVICGCDQGQPTLPVAPDPTPVATNPHHQ